MAHCRENGKDEIFSSLWKDNPEKMIIVLFGVGLRVQPVSQLFFLMRKALGF
jgi:hypothetical protein